MLEEIAEMYQQTIPLIIMLAAILAGILLNNKTAHDLKAELKADFQREIARLDDKIDAVSAKLEVIQADLRQFYHLSGKHEGRLEAIEKRLG